MPKFDQKNLFYYILLAIALVSLIFAIVCFCTDTSYAFGGRESNATYGGDAYTGMQNASAQTATNVYYLNRNIEILTSSVVTIGGFFFLLVALCFALAGIKGLGLLEIKPKAEAAAGVFVEDLPEIVAEEVTEEQPEVADVSAE